MLSRTEIIRLSLAVVATAMAAGLLLRGDRAPLPVEDEHSVALSTHVADRVGEVIPFQPRRERALEVGEIRILERGGRFTVSANHVSRLDILEELAERGDFVIFDHVRRHPFVSLDIREQSIEQLFARVVRDTPYTIRYAAADNRGAPLIDSLELGIEPETVEIGQNEQEAETWQGDRESREATDRKLKAADIAKRTENQRRRVQPRPEAERRIAMEHREQREAERHDRYLEELSHTNPEVRAWAASALDVEEPGDLISLGELLVDDPDPSVRAEIAYNLGFGNPETAVPMLVAALDDPSPKVVAVAAGALGFLDDPSVTDDLRGLLRNESESIRDAARDALDMLDGAQ